MPTTDALAADARSVLTCARELLLVVRDVEYVVDDACSDGYGTPLFAVPDDVDLAAEARRGAYAVLTARSGLGSEHDPDRELSLAMSGRLGVRSCEACDCCPRQRLMVALVPTTVVLTREPRDPRFGEAVHQQVHVEDFRSATHTLNRGYLQRTLEHANACHEAELRQAVAHATQVRPGELLAAGLERLTPEGVDVVWVDSAGAYSRTLRFPSPARSPEELGRSLRTHLHAGIC